MRTPNLETEVNRLRTIAADRHESFYLATIHRPNSRNLLARFADCIQADLDLERILFEIESED